MGPFPHDAPPPAISDDNPMGTDGFEFVEFAAQDPAPLAANFERLGFTAVAKHRSKDVTLYRQGEINFILNAEKDSFAEEFTAAHGPAVNAFAIRVKDAAKAMEKLIALGAEPVERKIGLMELNLPAIRGIGGAELYLVDRYGEHSIYDVDFEAIPGAPQNPPGHGLAYIDHLTHIVHRGRGMRSRRSTDRAAAQSAARSCRARRSG